MPTLGGDSVEAFVRKAEPLLRRALVARFGADQGREATADVLAWLIPRWSRIAGMSNPTGYAYRVAVNRTRRRLGRRRVLFPSVPADVELWVEPALPKALAALTPRQREVVVLVHGYGLTHREAADLLGISSSTIQNHVERGLAKLRANLGVPDNV